MEDSKTLFCSSEFQRAREGNSSKFTDHFGTYLNKHSPVLTYIFMSVFFTLNKFKFSTFMSSVMSHRIDW